MPRLSKQIRTALQFEAKRKQLIMLGKFAEARTTYQKQKDFLPDENTGKFWDEYYGQVEHQTEYPMEAWKLNHVLEELDLGKTILNIGVGDGKLEGRISAVSPKAKVTGVDFTKKLLQQVKKQFPHFRFLFQSSITDLKLKNESFDQVLLLEVLEHIIPGNTFAVLSEANRVLKPAGKLIVSVPVNEGLEEMLPINPNSHMRLYSPQLLRFELEQAGFAVEKIYQASAFQRWFWLKHFINTVFGFREPNNILIIARKLK